MPNAKKALTTQLVAVLAPYLEDEASSELSPDVIAKVLRKLAKQVRQLPHKATTGKVAATPLAKPAHKTIATQLTQQVKAHLGNTPAPPKALIKTIKHLAKQVIQQQRKQPAQDATLALPAAPTAALQASSLPPMVPPPAAKPKSTTTTRRPPAKQATKAAPDRQQ